MTLSINRLPRFWPVLAALGTTVPLWGVAIPPLIDLPGHMGRWRIMLAPEAPMLARSFAFRWDLVGNLGADLPMALLGPLIGLEPATWLLAALTIALTALALLLLSARVHGRPGPAVLLALPLAHGYAFQLGFLNFCLAQAGALLALVAWLGPERRRAQHWLVFAPLGLGLWLAHAMAWGLFGLAAFASWLARRRLAGDRWPAAIGGAVLACLPLALPLLPMLARSVPGEALTTGWFLWPMKAQWLVSPFRDRWQGLEVASMAALFLVPLLVTARHPLRASPLLLWPAMLCGAAFLLLPFWVMGSGYADMRALPFAAMLALVAVDAQGAGRRWLGIAGGLFLAVRLVAVTTSFQMYDQAWRRELVALDRLPRHASLLVIVNSECWFDWHLSRLQHVGALATVRRDAFTNDHFLLEGAQTLRLRRQDIGRYRENPSQLDVPAHCDAEPYAQLAATLADFPRAGFDHVWTIGFPPRADRPADLVPLWSDGRSTLYRVSR